MDETLIVQCAHCNRIKASGSAPHVDAGDVWLRTRLTRLREASHTICPLCSMTHPFYDAVRKGMSQRYAKGAAEMLRASDSVFRAA